MKIEFVPPQSVAEPLHWVRPEQVLAMVLRAGSIKMGVRRTDLTEFRYVPGELILPHRHEGKWVGAHERIVSAAQHFRCGDDGRL